MVVGSLREGDNEEGGGTGHHQRLLVPKRTQQVGLWLSALRLSSLLLPPLLLHPFDATQHHPLVGAVWWQMSLENGTLASMTSFPASFWLDDNECLRNPCEGRGRCVNNVGSYSCLCYPGYTLATLGDTQECQGE